MTIQVDPGIVVTAPVPQAVGAPALKVGYYQTAKHPKTTLCIDSFGRATLYEGSLYNRGPITPGVYSVCLESTKNYQEMVKAMEFVDIDVSYGALRPR